jgi:hypothetical protein
MAPTRRTWVTILSGMWGKMRLFLGPRRDAVDVAIELINGLRDGSIVLSRPPAEESSATSPSVEASGQATKNTAPEEHRPQ